MADKKLSKGKIIGGAFFVGLIATMVVVLINSWGSVFDQKIVINYPDGCQEVYNNGERVTPLCTEGRELLEEAQTPIYNLDEEKIEWENLTLNVSIS